MKRNRAETPAGVPVTAAETRRELETMQAIDEVIRQSDQRLAQVATRRRRWSEAFVRWDQVMRCSAGSGMCFGSEPGRGAAGRQRSGSIPRTFDESLSLLRCTPAHRCKKQVN